MGERKAMRCATMRCDAIRYDAAVPVTIRKSGGWREVYLDKVSYRSGGSRESVGGWAEISTSPNVGIGKWTSSHPSQGGLHQSCSSHMKKSPTLSDNEKGISKGPGIQTMHLSLNNISRCNPRSASLDLETLVRLFEIFQVSQQDHVDLEQVERQIQLQGLSTTGLEGPVGPDWTGRDLTRTGLSLDIYCDGRQCNAGLWV